MRLKRWIFWGLLIALGGIAAFAPLPSSPPAPGGRLVKVTAGDFSYTPGTIRVGRGELLTIEFTAIDVAHGLYIDGYGLEMSSEPGQTSRLTFLADRPGSFRLRCSLTCGGLHPFMIGKLEVGSDGLLARLVGLSLAAALAGLLLYRPGSGEQSLAH